ncbi:MAG: hypothetical protein RL671_878 [Pseudomonadota bacterium]|jgi:oligosaccharide repeat unit polymerase
MYEVALLLSVICLLAVLFHFARMPTFSVFHPLTFYLLFHGFIFVVRPIIAYLGDFRFIYQIYRFTPSYEDKLTVIFASNLGMLIFAFFSLQTGHAPMRFKQDVFTEAERNRLVPSALWALSICIPIGLTSLFWGYGRVASGFSDMVMDRGTGAFINTNANGYLAEAQLMLATACAMIGWLFRFRLIALLPSIAFVVFRAGTGGRGPFVTAAVCLGLLWLYEHRRKFPTTRALAGLAVIIALFVVVGQDRGRAIRLALSNDNTVIDKDDAEQQKFLEGMDFGNLEYFEFLVYAVPQRTGTYEYFADNLMLLTEPVPRVLWQGKPVGSPIKFFELFDYGYPVGMTRSLPGEGWAQLGWLGVILWCALWGLCFGAIYRRFISSGQSTFWVMAYMTFTSMLVVVYRDGTLITIMRQGVFYFFPIVLWRAFAYLLAVPRAAELRASHLAWLRRQGPALDAASVRNPAHPGASRGTRDNLPLAVARRKARLLQLREAGDR